ncbi:MAG: hypothetical protein QG557_567 [Pseudomonadota bacterium]|jgi:hypothetical protein|nr:hypothetical protein [Pseudomonadota bacterium]
MLHFFELFFELLFELVEFLEPYLLVTTIFFIPLTITITSIPKQFFKYEFTQHLLPSVYARYEAKKTLLEKLNTMTQTLMVVILMVDVFGLGHFFFGSHGGHHGGHEAGAHHEAGEHAPEHAAEGEVVSHGE